MRALSTAMALSCALVLGPSLAYAESFGAHAGKAACTLIGDDFGSQTTGDRSQRLSVAALNSSGHASENEHSPLVADRREGEDHDSDHHDSDDDATFDRRGGMENSAHFANGGGPQVFPDDRTSFGDVIGVEGFGDLARNITVALRNHERQLEHELAKRAGGGVLTPQAAAIPTPNPEPASMLLIGTGLAGLFRYRRQFFA